MHSKTATDNAKTEFRIKVTDESIRGLLKFRDKHISRLYFNKRKVAEPLYRLEDSASRD